MNNHIKTILLLYLITNLSLSQTLSIEKNNLFSRWEKGFIKDENYFPMHIGNQWQFLSYAVGVDVKHYSVKNYEIIKDTVLDGNTFFKFNNRYYSRWMRYSQEEQKIYFWSGDSNRLFMDFNLPAGANFTPYDPYTPEIATVIEGRRLIFGESVLYKGYIHGSPWIWGQKTERFGINLGPISDESLSLAGPDVWSNDTLIMTILYDSLGNQINFTNVYKPKIHIKPISTIYNMNFRLEYTIDHKYSRLFDSTSIHNGISFLDSVYMKSFYSKSDTIINNADRIASHTRNSNKYISALSLNLSLMKNDYAFNYRIIVKDKGIIPEFTSFPDSGYHQCIWEEPTTVKSDQIQELSYKLFQNYPNPFNPSTTIEYSIPKYEFVTIKVFDLLGNKISILVNEEQSPGPYKISFNSKSLPQELSSGIYFYQLRAGNFSLTRKFVLMK